MQINYNFPTKYIAVAVSGGMDSMALLHCLCNSPSLLRNATPLSHPVGFADTPREGNEGNYAAAAPALCVINIEHGIRGEDSLSDSKFVADYCKQNNIKCYQYKVDALKYSKSEKISLEAAARVLRYQKFYEFLEENPNYVIATAHHKQDNTESVLLNIFRGCGLNGLTGIKESVYGGRIVRPMLGVDKREIEEYVKKHNIPFVTDKTNNDVNYTRNYIRHEVLPRIYDKFPALDNAVLRLCENAKTDGEYFDRLANELITINGDEITLKKTAEKAVAVRAVMNIFKRYGFEDIESVHINAVYGLMQNSGGKMLNLPMDVNVYNDYEYLTFVKTFKITNYKLQITNVGRDYFKNHPAAIAAPLRGRGITNPHAPRLTPRVLYVDGDKLPQGYEIRTRKTGDIFKPFNGHTGSLKEYFINKKIKQRGRDNIPLIAFGNEILVIGGVEISDKVKITEGTKNILRVEVKMNNE